MQGMGQGRWQVGVQSPLGGRGEGRDEDVSASKRYREERRARQRRVREECERLRRENAGLEGALGALRGRRGARAEGVAALRGLCAGPVEARPWVLGLLLLLAPLVPLALPLRPPPPRPAPSRPLLGRWARDSLVAPAPRPPPAPPHSPLPRGVFVRFSELKDSLFKRG